ncbi:MAG: hypothetical protein JW791_01480 [Nanoarchaeota archaeon]|nr:hypothetical protein [Nanoarchaeota archaeon]
MDPKPSDISELDFFTRQVLEPKGFAFMWVYKPLCPDCKNSRLKKLKKRDKVYTCESCKKTFEKGDYGELLVYNIEYTCPKCGKQGTDSGKWKKPTSKTSTVMQKFECKNCGEKLKVSRMSKKKK